MFFQGGEREREREREREKEREIILATLTLLQPDRVVDCGHQTKLVTFLLEWLPWDLVSWEVEQPWGEAEGRQTCFLVSYTYDHAWWR